MVVTTRLKKTYGLHQADKYNINHHAPHDIESPLAKFGASDRQTDRHHRRGGDINYSDGADA